jgi:hypothetical protein
MANMTCDEIQRNAPSLEILEGAISMQKLQLALLQQEYAPNHPLFSNNSAPKTPNAEFTGGVSDFGSDKVTIGDGASVTSPLQSLDLDAEGLDARGPVRSLIACTDVALVIVEPVRFRA